MSLKYFKNIKNYNNFQNWLIRQFFNEEKNKQSPWFNKEVDAENVINYICKAENKFPYSPKQITEMWSCIEGINKNIHYVDVYIDKTEKQKEKSEKKLAKEYSLAKISEHLGGISVPAVSYLCEVGMQKFKTLIFDKHFDNMTESEIELFNQGIMKFRDRAADVYIKLLKDSFGDLKKFINILKSHGFISDKEIELLKEEEYDIILQLYYLEPEEIKLFLLNDIEKDDNAIQTYQCVVSKHAFPSKKRGRPKKRIIV